MFQGIAVHSIAACDHDEPNYSFSGFPELEEIVASSKLI